MGEQCCLWGNLHHIDLPSVWKIPCGGLASETAGEPELHVEQQRSKLQGFMKMLDMCVWVYLGGTCNDVQCPRNKCIKMAVWLYPNVIKNYT